MDNNSSKDVLRCEGGEELERIAAANTRSVITNVFNNRLDKYWTESDTGV